MSCVVYWLKERKVSTVWVSDVVDKDMRKAGITTKVRWGKAGKVAYDARILLVSGKSIRQ
jgi:hypothetical protein